MATSIGNLAVFLTANTTKFARGMMRATQPLRSFASSVARTSMRVASFGSALVGLGGGAGLAYLIKREYDVIDATGKMALRLGMATDALAALHHAANISGVATSEVDKSLERMLVRLAEAKQGTGEAKQAFAELGLSLDEMVTMAPDKILLEVAAALEDVQNQTKRAQLAYDIFGRSGVALLQMTADGAEGLREMMREARNLGVAFSDIDYANIAAAKDAMTRLKAAVEAVIARIAIALAPVIEDIGSKIIAMANKGETWGKKVKDAIAAVARKVREFAEQLRVAYQVALETLATFLEWRAAWIEFKLVQAETYRQSAVKGIVAEWQKVQMTLTRINRQIARLKGDFLTAESATPGWLQSAIDSLNRFGRDIPNVGEKLDQLRKRAKAAFEAPTKAAGKTVTSILNSLKEAVATFGYSARQIQLHRLVMAGATQEQINEALALVNKLDQLDAAAKAREQAKARGGMTAAERSLGVVKLGSMDMLRIIFASRNRNPMRRLEDLEEKVVTNTEVIARAIQSGKLQPQFAVVTMR